MPPNFVIVRSFRCATTDLWRATFFSFSESLWNTGSASLHLKAAHPTQSNSKQMISRTQAMLDSPDPRFETLNDLTTKYYRPQFDKTFNPGMFCAPTMWSIHPLTPDFLWLCGTSNTADGCKHFCVTSVRCKSDNCHISCMQGVTSCG